MKKIILSIATIFIFSISILGSTINIVNAGPPGQQAGEELHNEQKLIGSTGLLTGHQVSSRQCGFLEDFSAEMQAKQDANTDESTNAFAKQEVSLTNVSALVNNLIIDSGFTVVNAIAYAAMAAGSGTCGVDAATPADQTFLKTIFNQTRIFTELSNITWIAGLMSIIGIAQWFALLMMMFLILFKGFQAFKGKQIDPMNLILRFAAAVTLIYVAPYVLQDILNINNILSHYLSGMEVSLKSGDMAFLVRISEVLPASIIIVIMQIQEMMQAGIESAGKVTAPAGAISAMYGLIMLVVTVIIILVLMLIPFFKLIVWWYVRYFKIFVFAAISPFMFMTFADAETEKTGYNFLKNFSITVFEQFFMILGIGLTGVFISTVLPLMSQLGLGLIGAGIAIYAAISFLGTLPDVIGAWFQGGSGVRDNGSGMAGSLIKSSKNGMGRTKGAGKAAGSAIGGIQASKQRSNFRKDANVQGSYAESVRGDMKRSNYNSNKYGEKVGKAVTTKENKERDKKNN